MDKKLIEAILISIKPKYCKLIFEGKKKVEFRKVEFKFKFDKVIIYCTKPIAAILGIIYISDIIYEESSILWENFKEFSGLNKQEFNNYYLGNQKGTALLIDKIIKFSKPLSIKDVKGNIVPPQSFLYLTKKQTEMILKLAGN
ncbi:MAG: ASCH domain-containing protein [Ignavibacteriaceae bacterium]